MKKLVKTLAVIVLTAVLVSLCLPAAAAVDEEVKFPIKSGAASQTVYLIQDRLRAAGYLHFRSTGKYGTMTENAVMAFQRNNGLSRTGNVDQKTYEKLFGAGNNRAAGNDAIPRVHGPGQTARVDRGVMGDWNKLITHIFPVGGTALVTDYYSGAVYTVRRTGGLNHADVTVTEGEDARSRSFGGETTWEKRPVTVTIDGEIYAASIFGCPNANGEYSLYFSGSRSDVGAGIPDAEHEDNVKLANGQYLS